MSEGEWRRGPFTISTDRSRIVRDRVLDFLETTYWGRVIPRERLAKGIDNARVYGLYDEDAGGAQVGFARVVTDEARFAWLSDVFVLPDYRGRGLGEWLTETILADPPLAEIDRWLLATSDAQDFYTPFGFAEITEQTRGPRRFMLRVRP